MLQILPQTPERCMQILHEYHNVANFAQMKKRCKVKECHKLQTAKYFKISPISKSRKCTVLFLLLCYIFLLLFYFYNLVFFKIRSPTFPMLFHTAVAVPDNLSPCVIESCLTPGDNRSNISPYSSLSGVPSHDVYSWTFDVFRMSSHLVLRLHCGLL